MAELKYHFFRLTVYCIAGIVASEIQTDISVLDA